MRPFKGRKPKWLVPVLPWLAGDEVRSCDLGDICGVPRGVSRGVSGFVPADVVWPKSPCL